MASPILAFTPPKILPPGTVIHGDTISISTTNAYLSANPTQLTSAGWVEFEFTPKLLHGANSFDCILGFNNPNVQPTKFEIWVNYPHNKLDKKQIYDQPSTKTFLYVTNIKELDIKDYSLYSVNYGTNMNTQLCEIVYSGGTKNIIAYNEKTNWGLNTTFNYSSEATIPYVHEETYWDWLPIDTPWIEETYNHEGMDTWFTKEDIPVTKDTNYKARAYINIPFKGLEENSGEYYWAIKPHTLTLKESISQDKITCLDPWWNNSWSYYKYLGINHKNDSYQMRINLSKPNSADSIYTTDTEGHCADDFGDIRFTDVWNNTLSYWIENYTTAADAIIWVKVPANVSTSHAGILMYYGSAGATSIADGNDTFIFFDDFDGAALDVYKWNGISGTIPVANGHVVLDASDRMYTNNSNYGLFNSPENGGARAKTNLTVTDFDNYLMQFEPYENFSYSLRMVSSDNDAPGNIDGVSCVVKNWNDVTEESIVNDHSCPPMNSQNRLMIEWANISNNESPFANFWVINNTGGEELCIFQTTNILAVPDIPLNLTHACFSPTASAMTINWTWVGKFNVTEPNFFNIGAEVAKAGTTPSFYTNTTGYEFGNWSFQESVREGSLDEEWFESNYTSWGVNWSDQPHMNWTYVWNSSGQQTFGYSLLNNSGMNRSQSLVWIQYNTSQSWYYDTYMGVVYAARNASSFDMALYGWNGQYVCYMLSWNGTNLTNSNDSTLVEYPWDAYDYAQDDLATEHYWEFQPWEDTGAWIKTIYNEYNGRVQTKCWGDPSLIGLMAEDLYWCYDGNLTNETTAVSSIKYDNNQSYGLAVWSPNATADLPTAHFDTFNLWQLNYSLNSSAWINISDNNHSRPHMDYPIVNALEFAVELSQFWNATMTGNATMDNVSWMMKNITNKMNLESRPYDSRPHSTNPLDQNDTVYYYSCIFTNWSQFVQEYIPDAWHPGTPNSILYLHIQACHDGSDDLFVDGCFVGFDVDNDRKIDDNDRFFWFDDVPNNFEWHGNTFQPGVFNAVADTYPSDTDSYINLHRYREHMQFNFLIGLDQLKKSNGENITLNDVFGLTILTYNFDDDAACVWQNWNETNPAFATDDQCYHSEIDASVVKQYFFNQTYFFDDDLQQNTTTLTRFGEGQIRGTWLNSTSGGYVVTIDVNSSNTSIDCTNASFGQFINLTINVTAGGAPLTGIFVNFTWLNCSCSDWNFTYNCSGSDIGGLIDANLTFYNDTCNATLTLQDLAIDQSIEAWIRINITECTDTNGSFTIWANVTTTEGALDYDSVNVTWCLSTTLLRIVGRTLVPNVANIADSVFNILGIVMIIGAIMLIVGIVFNKSGVK